MQPFTRPGDKLNRENSMVQVKINGGAMLIALILSTVGCAVKHVVLVTVPNATFRPASPLVRRAGPHSVLLPGV